MTQAIPQISLIAAFSAGLLSFVSPCVLPLVPSYISYITGLSVEQLTDASERVKFKKAIVLNSLLFIAGFSSVFIAFGASASLLGQVLITYQDHIRRFGGVLIVVFGLYLLGILNLNFLKVEHRFQFRSRPAGYLGSFLIGVAFAAGWTPCVGPVLGSILLYASTTDSLVSGVVLLTSYSLGLGLPLFLTALGVDRFLAYFKQARAYLWGVSTVSGVLLVVVGVMIYANSLTMVTSFLERYGIGWYLGQ
ncbi:MAG: sulfite exporter TauE/SafE family protein [Nitrospiraceae bacterium]|jgi:cytochrome c-type biogenesis protein|uniref:cytochrome c biogenesis CcdA family protein n=1 Tax=Nitrospira cf. moscoviensis SBR1015 TaxID=96242 RepID=UPI000A0A6300|nr:cytochrome c biogenesis protein CcdA [Nitrospira cf. moscoviensis SBR1015]MBY0247131.1 sulfite exporter TauE/SafE family protein [Nitrospiraceae bacterium]OQW31129.1 MAG: cytochrome C biogenesis protein [Nitrospira sp. SG-bin2]